MKSVVPRAPAKTAYYGFFDSLLGRHCRYSSATKSEYIVDSGSAQEISRKIPSYDPPSKLISIPVPGGLHHRHVRVAAWTVEELFPPSQDYRQFPTCCVKKILPITDNWRDQQILNFTHHGLTFPPRWSFSWVQAEAVNDARRRTDADGHFGVTYQKGCQAQVLNSRNIA